MEKRFRTTPYLLVILLVVLATGFGCADNFFEQKAGDRITPDQHFKSIINAEVSFVGAISPMKEFMPRFIMLDGLRSDQMDVVNGRADAYLAAINDQSFTPGNPYTDPAELYKVIINVNEILANMGKLARNDRNADTVYVNYMNTALIGLRSWAYFTIVRLYNEAVYIDGNLASLPPNLEQKKLSKEVIIDTLINQLQRSMAKNDITKFDENGMPGVYPNPKAILGELYLEKNVYDSAVIYLKLACESFGNSKALYKVDKTYTKDAWGDIFAEGQDALLENISSIPFTSIEDQVNPLARWMLYSDQYMVKPSKVLIDSFQVQVGLKGVPGDLYRGLGVTYDTVAGETYIKKYSLNPSEPYSSDIVISRAAGVHLLLAEALNRSGDSKTALIILNDGFLTTKTPGYTLWVNNLGIRGRAYLKNRASALTGNDLMLWTEDMILVERSLEMAFEGTRWFDLVRIAERRADPEYLAGKVASKFTDPAKAAAIHDFLIDPNNWYLK